MAKVLLHTVALDNAKFYLEKPKSEDPNLGQWLKGAYQLFLESASHDPFQIHSLTHDPAEADLIIFCELGAQGLFAEWVRHHPWVGKYREKCFIFDVGDKTLPFLPGLYASLRKSTHNPGRTRTGYYLRTDENPFIDNRPVSEISDLLACFVGSLENHPVRQALAKIAGSQLLIEDTSSFAQKMLYHTPEEKSQAFWPHYADVMASAAFSLCPRGRGPGSIRLFEALQMGRCPVIIADEWIYPRRVDWSACSITVLEKDIPAIPEILQQNRHRAPEMGIKARQEWETYYSPPVRFHWLVEDCLEILSERRMPEALAGRLVWAHLLNRKVFRNFLTSKNKIRRQTGKLLF
jgi:hypothetical protein